METDWLNPWLTLHLVPDASRASPPGTDGFHFAVKDLGETPLSDMKAVLVARMVDGLRNGYIPAGFITQVVVVRAGKDIHLSAPTIRNMVKTGFEQGGKSRLISHAGMDPITLFPEHIFVYGSRFWWKGTWVTWQQAAGILHLLRLTYTPKPAPLLNAADSAINFAIRRKTPPIGLITSIVE